jgi:hypothetical protein
MFLTPGMAVRPPPPSNLCPSSIETLAATGANERTRVVIGIALQSLDVSTRYSGSKSVAAGQEQLYFRLDGTFGGYADAGRCMHVATTTVVILHGIDAMSFIK